jgi:menaquinone-dependent protoporphyrinogen oxidase
MKILIVYGTTEGQTRKIAEFIAGRLRTHGDDVALVDEAAGGAPDPGKFDAAILAASIHASQYQKPVIAYARGHALALSAMPSMFLSVSLAAAGTDKEDLQGIAKCAANFLAETGWQKAEVHHVAGSFRFSEYDFFKGWVMRMIARQKKVKLKPGEDLELTDWEALGRLTEAFRARLAPRASKAG